MEKARRHPTSVALIGCGFTGTSAFFQLVNGYPVDRITIFEASGNFGPGYPYQQNECRDYLINNTTDTMCLVPSNRRAFLDWLKARELDVEIEDKGHLPRSLFGEFLVDVFRSTRTLAAVKGIEVQLVPEEVTRLREDDEGRVHIDWAGAETSADMAILTTGRCPDLDAYEHPPAGGSASYFATHVMCDELDAIPLNATIHILGASLSAYDVVNRLYAPETGCAFERDAAGELRFESGPNERKVVLCSRSGRVKAMQSRVPGAIDRRHFTEQGLRQAASERDLTLDDVARLIRLEAEAHGACVDWRRVASPYEGCQSADAVQARAGELLESAIVAAREGEGKNFLVDFFDEAQIAVWDGFADRLLAPEQERLYREQHETAALSYVAPCPIETAERLLALHRSGRLRVLKGTRDVLLADDGSHYELRHAFGVESAQVLVNATGSVDRDVTSPKQPPLIRDLVAKGYLSPYTRDGVTMKGADVDMSSFRLRGAKSIYLANMLLWGPGFFTSSAFTMASIVERLLKECFRNRRNE